MINEKYIFLEQISEEEHTRVYRARSIDNSDTVLITTLQAKTASDSAIARLSNQHHILKELKSPSIIRSYDLLYQDNLWIWVSEFLEYDTFREFLQEHTVSYKEILTIAVSIIDVIDYLHKHQIIHQNITPDSIYILPNQRDIILSRFDYALRLPSALRSSYYLRHPERPIDYLTPEHTHLVSPTLNYQSDLYCFGIMLYEVIAGILPFQATNQFDLGRQHHTKLPLPLNTIEPNVPLMLSQIVEKLLAPQLHQRYLNAAAVREDLQRCLEQLTENPDQVNLRAQSITLEDINYTKSLFGRSSELTQLEQLIEGLVRGNGTIVTISGPLGIGKTSLAYEIYNTVLQHQGFFVVTRCSYTQSYRPYGVILEALEYLLQQILVTDQQHIELWSARLHTALQVYPALLIQHLPILRNFLSDLEPEELQLSLSQQKHHLLLSLQRLVHLFACAEHPLVLVIENMQWIDYDLLHLLQQLYTFPQENYILIVGTYRTSEQHETYPLSLIEDILYQDEIPYYNIPLSPLSKNDILHMTQAMVKLDETENSALTNWLFEYSTGNPLLAKHCIKMLLGQRILLYDAQREDWHLNTAQLSRAQQSISINDTIQHRYELMPPDAQRALLYAACFGRVLNVQLLAAALQQDVITTVEQLFPAIQIGLIQPLHTDLLLLQSFNHTLQQYFTEHDLINGVEVDLDQSKTKLQAHDLQCDCQFISDQISPVLYRQLSVEEQQHIHLTIAYLLEQHLDELNKPSLLFDMVNHFNQSISLIHEPNERKKICELNLLAGQKALRDLEFVLAEHYFSQAYYLLPGDVWKTDYDLANHIYRHYSMISAYNGNHEQAEILRIQHIPHLKTLYQQAEVHIGQIKTYIAQKNYQQAFHLGIYALRLFGIDIIESESEAAVRLKELQDTIKTYQPFADMDKWLTYSGTVAHEIAIKIQILLLLISIDFTLHANLTSIIILEAVKLIFENGPNKYVGLILSLYAQNLSLHGDIEQASRYSKLALQLQERFGHSEYLGQIQHIIASSINIWLQPYKEVLSQLQQAYHQSYEYGDTYYATRSLLHASSVMLSQGCELHKISTQISKHLPAIRTSDTQRIYSPLGILYQAILNLQGKLPNPITLDSSEFTEATLLDAYFIPKNRAYYHIYKTFILFLYGNYSEAVVHGSNAEYYIEHIVNTNAFVQYRFFYTLALINNYPDIDPQAQQHARRIIEEHINYFRSISDHNIENYLAAYCLLNAEYARINEKTTSMLAYYDQAIEAAHENKQIYIEAIAYEQSAKFYLATNRQRLAKQYMSDAYACYLHWGAISKVNLLTSHYAHLLPSISESISSSISSPNIPSIKHSIDRDLFFQILNIIAAPNALETMIEQVLPLLLQLTSSHNIYLFLERQNQLRLLAATGTTHNTLEHSLPMPFLENALIENTPLIIQNLALEPSLREQAYFKSRQIKSLLCMSLTSQTRVIGLLYLENVQTVNAFGTQQIASLNIIASQLANALEHASLSQDIDQIIHKLLMTSSDLINIYTSKTESIPENINYIPHPSLADAGIDIIAFDDQTIVMQLSGAIDSPRINQAITTLNTNLLVRPAETLVIDVSALPNIDLNVATLLLHLIDTTSQQLTSYINGINQDLLSTLTKFGIDLHHYQAPNHLRAALAAWPAIKQ